MLAQLEQYGNPTPGAYSRAMDFRKFIGLLGRVGPIR